jgi:hypothetical protein
VPFGKRNSSSFLNRFIQAQDSTERKKLGFDESPAGWAATVGYGFVKYRRRSWPMVLGAPLAIFPILLWGYFLIYGGP